MKIGKLKKFNSKQQEITEVLEAVDEVLDEVTDKEVLNGQLIKGLKIVPGTPLRVKHRLGRKPEGYIVVKKDKAMTVYQSNSSIPTKELVLHANLITDWISYTPTLINMTADNAYFYYRRNGDSIDIKGRIVGNLSVTGTIYFTIPSGLEMDQSKLPDTAYGMVGLAEAIDAGSGGHLADVKQNNTSVTQLGFYGEDGVGWWTPTIPFTWASGDNIKVKCDSIPVTGSIANNETTTFDLWVF